MPLSSPRVQNISVENRREMQRLVENLSVDDTLFELPKILAISPVNIIQIATYSNSYQTLRKSLKC